MFCAWKFDLLKANNFEHKICCFRSILYLTTVKQDSLITKFSNSCTTQNRERQINLISNPFRQHSQQSQRLSISINRPTIQCQFHHSSQYRNSMFIIGNSNNFNRMIRKRKLQHVYRRIKHLNVMR